MHINVREICLCRGKHHLHVEFLQHLSFVPMFMLNGQMYVLHEHMHCVLSHLKELRVIYVALPVILIIT